MAIERHFNFGKALDRIKIEIDTEDTLAGASEQMELEESFEQARLRGKDYGNGYYDGWWDSVKYYKERTKRRRESIHKKYHELYKRWVLKDGKECLDK